MKKILVIGAGRSSSALLHYLEENSRKYGWEITAGDRDLTSVQAKVTESSRAIAFDVSRCRSCTLALDKTMDKLTDLLTFQAGQGYFSQQLHPSEVWHKIFFPL